MAPYDVLMILVLAGATVFGAWKGMAWQIASLSSLVLSYLVALRFSPQLAQFFGQKAPLNRFLAMLAIYLGTSLVIWMAFRVVAGVIDRVRLKEFDRQVGALFGLAKGTLLCVAITFFAVTLSAVARDRVLESRSGPTIARLLNRAPAVMPPELHELLRPYMERLETELNSPQAKSAEESAPLWRPPGAPAGSAPSEPKTPTEPTPSSPKAPLRQAIRWLGEQGSGGTR
jgi:membrane protein required for colicin V production